MQFSFLAEPILRTKDAQLIPLAYTDPSAEDKAGRNSRENKINLNPEAGLMRMVRRKRYSEYEMIPFAPIVLEKKQSCIFLPRDNEKLWIVNKFHSIFYIKKNDGTTGI